mgnify:FL=1
MINKPATIEELHIGQVYTGLGEQRHILWVSPQYQQVEYCIAGFPPRGRTYPNIPITEMWAWINQPEVERIA